MSALPIINAPAPNTPYFTPAQHIAAGTAVNPQPDGRPIPKPFLPLTVRSLTFHNRIWLSPLAQYSADEGKLTPWHLAHLGGIFTRGPGLSFVEATAVSPEGRTSPQDAGLWDDAQVEPLRQIVEFAHSQNQKVAIQLVHSGRKGSTVALWLSTGAVATAVDGGWPDAVVGPTDVPYSESLAQPKALTREGIKGIVNAYAAAAKRAIKAGVDVIEIHGAHGFLITEFLSPHTNTRTDEYGGSWENRIRLAVEIIDAVRAVIPPTMPLFFRISATEWLEYLNEPSWTLEDTKRFAGVLAAHGVDLYDISSSGNSPQQKIDFSGTFASQADFSAAVRAHVEAEGIVVAGTGAPLLVSAVGGISTGERANAILEEGKADAIFVGRYFQQEPGLVWKFARELGVEIHNAHQIGWPFAGRGSSVASQKRSESRREQSVIVPKADEK